ncbi:MAG TPA: YbgC/FadM family acyl-CoA thioesterase [Desulfuromonadales bacterium]|nr:YbgC/FadM family acyl-CoA thioesterase [Desulfuromonadales bacterium]
MDIRIYYEDTDAAGVVYHSNYIKYFERARTEYLRDNGLTVAQFAEDGFVFPVIRVEIEYKSPARLDDLLTITTLPVRTGGSSFTISHSVIRKSDGTVMAEAVITLVCVNPELKPVRIPATLRTLLESVPAPHE